MSNVENPDLLTTEQPSVSTTTSRKNGNSMPAKFSRYALLFDNLSEVAEAKAYAATIGYDDAKIKVGQDLFKSAKAIVEVQNLAYGRWRGLVAEVNGLKQELHDEYMRHLTFVRKAFEGQVEILESLKAYGPRKKQFDHWSSNVSTFYHYALASTSVKTALAQHMVDEKQLKAAQQKLKVLNDLHLDKIQQNSEYRKLTYQKNQEVLAIDKWVNTFNVLANRHFLRNPEAKIVLAL